MARRDDLEQSIREGYRIIRRCEMDIQVTSRDEEKLRAQRMIDEQVGLIEGYLAEYRPLVGGVLPDEIAEIAARFSIAAQERETYAEPRSVPLAIRQPFEPEMILIPAGEFLMGSDPATDKDAQDDKQPQHRLYLPDYCIGKTPVTNAQYLACTQATRHRPPAHWEGGKPRKGKENHPVVGVSWYDALEYCRWLSNVTGKPYSLPSEAEWEKAARGTDGRIYPWGNQWDATRCNIGKSRIATTTPVDAYPQGASPYGVLDMAGNVSEWTRSLWGEDWVYPEFRYPYHPNDGRENLDAPAKVGRVIRGGSFYLDRDYARCAYRGWFGPNYWYIDIGFRVVLSPAS
jgi:formylglycine-generating enzyme required for sulfatase activity